MRKMASLAALAALVVSVVGSSAFATPFPGTCSTTGATTFAKNSAVAGTIAPESVAKYKLTVASGETAQIVMEAGGDADMSVCKGTNTIGCYSHNMVPVPDACADEGFEGIQGFGPALGAGTWIIMINHCTDVQCGYPADSPAPIPFVLANVVA